MLAGKVILITGATSGIGAATAREAARRGGKVVLSGRRRDLGEKLAADLRAQGYQDVLFVECDVTCEENVKHLVKVTLDTFGRLDHAFNNAGVGGMPGIEEREFPDMKVFDSTMDVNVRGVFLCMRHQIPAMLSTVGKGSIVNTASTAGLRGVALNPIYSASKHAVCGLSKSVALLYAPSKIRVNTVCPAFFPTEMTEGVFRSDGVDRIVFDVLHPIGRTGELPEVVAAVLWLLSDEASFITATDLAVDGGLTNATGIQRHRLPVLSEAVARSQKSKL